ncbi:dihydrofolate reductase [Microlunatus elymi]|uniref:Dihydrofolate reductase n=1 Tax=Microlunatus elymi TaxID=2596828 RepID=A0A516PX95_9ACTN|nr:dihydrofolate reductase [Microlunatus elymi]QDP95800.1 dihydrofolate reductase [Microlunatus elymi]
MPDIIAIAAVARNGVIGAGPEIPWRLKGDQLRFKQLTRGHVLIMGRKTYESIGRPLPGRTTYVITRDPHWRAEGVRTFASLDEALDAAALSDPAGPIWIGGGGDIYRLALQRCDGLEITEVDAEPAGDATFPAIDHDHWVETARDDDHDGYAWVSYRRRSN